MKAALVCALALAAACSKGEEKKPAAGAAGASAGDAGAKVADTAKRKPPDAGANPAEHEGRAFLDRWLAAQNQGDFAAYSALYAPAFSGIRRSGKSVKKFDRDGWLADRKKMFAEKMIVGADNPVFKSATGGIEIELEQTWESGSYADKGLKRIVLAGGLVVGEEMLASTVKVMAGATCAEALVPDPDDRKQVRDTKLFAPTNSKYQVCVLERRQGEIGEFEVALLEPRGTAWAVRGKPRSFPYSLEGFPDMGDTPPSAPDPDHDEKKSADLRAELVSIAPAEQALLVDVSVPKGQLEMGMAGTLVLFRLVDQLEPLIEQTSETDDGEEAKVGTEVSLDVKDRKTKGYFDISVTVTTVNNQWASEDPSEREHSETEKTVYRWDGSGYLAK